MKKPYGVEEWDGYSMPNVPSDRKPLSKEEEDRVLDEMRRRIEEKILAQNKKKRDVV